MLYVALTRAEGRLYLPRYPARSTCAAAAPTASSTIACTRCWAAFTARRDPASVPARAGPLPARRRRRRAGRARAAALAGVAPPPALLAPPVPHDAFRQAAAERAPDSWSRRTRR